MAKDFEELKRLKAKARREGITMSELGRRGGMKAARLAREKRAKEEKAEKEAKKPKQLEMNFEQFFKRAR